MGYSDEVECPNNPSLGFFIDCSNNIYSCALLENYGNDTCDEGTNCNNNNTNCTNFNCLAWGFDGAECHDDNGNSWQGQIGSDYYCIGGIENIQNGDCDDCSGVPNGDSYLDNCGVCDNDLSNDCIQDCSGAWGGSAQIDNCGVCDADSSNDCVQDCYGVWGGSAEYDECNICGGPGILEGHCDCEGNEFDCNSVCGGNSTFDNCGTCDADLSNDCVADCSGTWGGSAQIDNCGVCDADSSNDCVQDCYGVWGGNAQLDECNICGGPGILEGHCDCAGQELDCNGICGGDASLDNCGNCDNDLSNDCVADCSGTWGGSAQIDNCGVCDNDPSNNCEEDCYGVWGGNAELDECGICDGDNSACVDCAGIPNGTNQLDNCGICNYDLEDDCQLDCNGVWGGTAYLDGCGVCSGGSTGHDANSDIDSCGVCFGQNECFDCNDIPFGGATLDNCGICDIYPENDCVPDCNNEWGGDAFFDNCNQCVGGNTSLSECEQDCNDVWGGNALVDDCNICGGANFNNEPCGANEVSIQDVPDDQGNQVIISFKKSFYDSDPLINRSEVYTIELKDYITDNWISVQTVGAYSSDLYSVLVPTLQNCTNVIDNQCVDETANTEFRIIANMDEGNFLTESIIGFSEDNIHPSTPAEVYAIISPAYNEFYLSWEMSNEQDFSYYQLNNLANEVQYTTNNELIIELNQNLLYEEYYINSFDIHENMSGNSDFISIHNIHAGNNLVSFSVVPEDNSIYNFFNNYESIITSIIGAGSAAMYFSDISDVGSEDSGWSGSFIGSLTEIKNNEAYWLRSLEDIKFLAVAKKESVNQFQLEYGHNLIPYTCSFSDDINNIIQNECISGIIGEGDAAIFQENIGWVGSINKLQPGKGYWMWTGCEETILNYTCLENSNDTSLERNNKQILTPEIMPKQSMRQSFYFLENIDGAEIGDVVYSYNDKTLVGSRIWNGAFTDIPVMGNDGTIDTESYCNLGDIPTFKLLKKTGEIYDIEGVFPNWTNNGLFIINNANLVDENILIDDFKILSVYPNPFNPIANIEYSIGQESNLSINIYDINGREIEKLFEGYKDSGSYSLSWNASEQATGVYFIKFKVNNTLPIVHRLVLIK